jgi:hypothetical protein
MTEETYIMKACLYPLCGLLLAVPAVAGADDCRPVVDAMQKLAITPVHEYMQETAAFRKAPSSNEAVIIGSAMYVRVSGQWHTMPYDPKERAQEIAQSTAGKHATCRYLRDENVGSEAASVYATHDDQGEGSTVDNTLWISKSRGLPLRQGIDIDVGGKFGKSHTDIRFDYADVRVPVDVK